MAFIDTTAGSFTPRVTEADIQARFADLLATQGWTIAANFKKVVFDAQLTFPIDTYIADSEVKIVTAEHFIYANKENKKVGVAIVGKWSQNVYKIREANKSPEVAPFGTATLEDFGLWATNEFRKYRSPQTLYVYMVEELKDLKPNGSDVVLGWDTSDENTLLRAALDIEVETSYWDENRNFAVTKTEPGRMQSPILHAGLRTDKLEDYYDDILNYPIQNTNWWNDSEISFKGHLNDTNFFFIVQCDNVPAPEGNLVPSIPFFFGKLDPVEEGDVAYALFCGSVPVVPGIGQAALDAIRKYDYDNTATRTPNIMPLMKSYPKYPANGIDNVMVQRSKLGARYQAHYLSWNAPSNDITPARTSEDGERDYPRAWNNYTTPLYKYSFNPSRYSHKVHTSKIYVVHPEEGVRGSLQDSIALSALSFSANKLRVKRAWCPNEFDVYRYFLVEGLSPFTKKPGTQYRPAGIGLYFNTIDDNGVEVTTPTPAP